MIINSYIFGGGYDTDAQAYFDSATGLSTVEKDAWNDFVVSAKANGYYSKFVAFYPLRGGDASNQKWNAIDPSDTDVAFRITWNGTSTHNSTGYVSNGSTGYGDTHFVPEDDGTGGDFSFGAYLSGNYSDLAASFGGGEGGGRHVRIIPRTTSNFAQSIQGSETNKIITANSNSEAFWVSSVDTATSHKLYKNGSQLGSTQTTITTGGWNLISYSLYVGAYNGEGTVSGFGSWTTQCYFIATGLSSTNVSDFNTDIEVFMDALSIGVQA